MTGNASESKADSLPTDRRSKRRYELRLEARWKLLHRRRVLDQGVCQTLDFSSGGILLEVGRKLPIGLPVELSVVWPVALDGGTPLQLAIAGDVVRADPWRAAIRLKQYEFRTAAVRREQPNSSRISAAPLSLGNSQPAFFRRPAPVGS